MTYEPPAHPAQPPYQPPDPNAPAPGHGHGAGQASGEVHYPGAEPGNTDTASFPPVPEGTGQGMPEHQPPVMPSAPANQQPVSPQPASQQPAIPPGQVPPGYGMPGAPGQAPAPPSKKTNWKIPIIIGAVVLVLCCVGAIVAGFGIFNAFKDATGATKSAAAAYLDDVQKGNYGSAYERLCENVKREFTPQEFAQAQSMVPPITGYEITRVNVMTSGGKTTGTVDAEVTREGVGRINQTVVMVKEDGEWKVCQRGV